MKFIDIYKIPTFKFACVYEADTYNRSFSIDKTILEFTYIAEGCLEVIKGDKTYTAEKGDILCALRDVNTSAKTSSYHCHHVVGIKTEWEMVESSAYGFCIPYIIKKRPETEEIAKMIDEFIYSSHIYENSSGRTSELFFSILCKIDKISRKSEEFHQPEYSLVVEKAKSYIHKNINKPISQKEVAKHLGTSPSYLCSVFKKTEGISLIKYVNTTKLKCIETLMRKENLPMYKAAEIYGYADANYVSALFKKTFGRNITNIIDYQEVLL